MNTAEFRFDAGTSSGASPLQADDMVAALEALAAVPLNTLSDIRGPAWALSAALTVAARRGGSLRGVSRGETEDTWGPASGVFPTLRVSCAALPCPLLAASVRVGEAASLQPSGRLVDAIRQLSGDGARSVPSWRIDGVDVGWGAVVTSTGFAGVGMQVSDAPPRAHVRVVTPNPAEGGGLLGLVRGTAGLFSGAPQRDAAEVTLVGGGRVMVDGWAFDVPNGSVIRVGRGPTLALGEA